MSTVCQFERLSWTELAAHRDAGAGLVLLPCGATEQHGPHLPVNTDTVIAERVCLEAATRSGVLVLPALAYTVSSGHTRKWPGTFSLRHETFIHTVCEIAGWLRSGGWSRLLLVNSHFGNDASLRVAVEKIRLEHLGRLQVGLKHTFLLTPAIRDYFVSDADDLHANRAETDLMLHLAPDTVRMDLVEDDPDRTAGTVFSHPVSQTSLNGVTGAPSLGEATRGATLFEEMVAALVSVIETAKTEEPPLPKEYWSSSVS
jgi:creatinine amidohydrolase